MRNHPYLTTLDGENFMEALNMQQNNMVRSQQKDLLIREYAAQTEFGYLETKAIAHKATQIPETRYYDISDSSPESSPPGTNQTYNTLNTPITLVGRSPPSHHSIIPPTPIRSILIDPPLPPDHTGTAELDIEEERNRRLAERVSKRIEGEAKAKAMLKQLPKRRLDFEEEEPEPTNTGASSSSSGGMSGYIAGVPAVVGGAGKAARTVAGAVGALEPGKVVGTITGGTIGAAAIGVIEAGRGIYHTGATAGGMLVDYYLGGDGEEQPSPPSAGSTPEPKSKGRPNKN
jgi:hypothetical protein